MAARSCGPRSHGDGGLTMRRQLQIDDANLLEPHDHVAWYGDGAADLYLLASTALAAGARRNEKLLFVAEDPDATRLGEIADLDRLLDVGQLELLAIDAVYGAWSTFSPTVQLATFEDVLASALADGYRGIRVVADNTPLVCGDDDGFRRWLAWEQITDRFQAKSEVTGICYFDRGALSDDRRSDLAALHPVRSASSDEPPFTLLADDDAVSVSGTVDTWSADQFRRIVDTTPGDGPLVVDLSRADFIDHRALLALNAVASAGRPIHICGASPPLPKLPALLGIATPHLRFA
jgi:anti-anti-sigma regulatory factor